VPGVALDHRGGLPGELDAHGLEAAARGLEPDGAPARVQVEAAAARLEGHDVEQRLAEPRGAGTGPSLEGLERAPLGAPTDDARLGHASRVTASGGRRRRSAPSGGVEWATVIRSLAADELPWFVDRALAFIGHSDPQRLALLLSPRFADARADARACRVLVREGGAPSAGVPGPAPHPAAAP